jgi:antirestriction protein ArdC
LASWLEVLKADASALFTIASKAQAATDYLAERAGLVTEDEDGGAVTSPAQGVAA